MPPKRTTTTITTTPMTDAAIKALIAQGVADALAEYEAHRSSRNGDDSHASGSGRRIERAARECTYNNFLKCQPLISRNSHVKTVGHDAAYGMPWKILKKIMTNKYCLRDEVEKYVRGLLDMIQGSVMASKPKTMQDAIEFATELMDKKIRSLADRQAENKRKLDDTSSNNQKQQ
ncbi:hypothetical protein Tco_0647964 [Tanacetum coccineum]